jgi:hypothetical protein
LVNSYIQFDFLPIFIFSKVAKIRNNVFVVFERKLMLSLLPQPTHTMDEVYNGKDK